MSFDNIYSVRHKILKYLWYHFMHICKHICINYASLCICLSLPRNMHAILPWYPGGGQRHIQGSVLSFYHVESRDEILLNRYLPQWPIVAQVSCQPLESIL